MVFHSILTSLYNDLADCCKPYADTSRVNTLLKSYVVPLGPGHNLAIHNHEAGACGDFA